MSDEHDEVIGAIIKKRAGDQLIEAMKENTKLSLESVKRVDDHLLELVLKIEELNCELQTYRKEVKKIEKRVFSIKSFNKEQQEILIKIADREIKKKKRLKQLFGIFVKA